jgi:ferredoxin
MSCVSKCPSGSILFSRPQKNQNTIEEPTNLSRRAFILKGTAVTLAAVGTGHIWGDTIRSFARSNRSVEGLILPPGALNIERFMAKCTSCQLCGLHCPTKVIRPSSYALGPVSLNFDHAACQYDCTKCNAVCPFGALQSLSLENKQWLKIGEAFCDTSKCRVIKDNIACDLCIKACPKDAIFTLVDPNGFEVPEVAAFHCIGCGACQSVCPMTPKAITVAGTEQSIMG